MTSERSRSPFFDLLGDNAVIPALYTPSTDSEIVNFPALETLVEALIAEGATALYVLGTTGEGVFHHEESRRAAAEHVIQKVNGRAKVIIHVGADSPYIACRLAKHANSVGADAISATGPKFPTPTVGIEASHLARIGEATELPFMGYFLQGTGSEDVDALLARLCKIPRLSALKMTTSDPEVIRRVVDRCGDKIYVASGCDEKLLECADAGAHGAIGSTYNWWLHICQTMLARHQGGDSSSSAAFMDALRGVCETAYGERGHPDFYGFARRAVKLAHSVDIGDGIAAHTIDSTDWDRSEVERQLATVTRFAS